VGTFAVQIAKSFGADVCELRSVRRAEAKTTSAKPPAEEDTLEGSRAIPQRVSLGSFFAANGVRSDDLDRGKLDPAPQSLIRKSFFMLISINDTFST
jgi:hypothetical protein